MCRLLLTTLNSSYFPMVVYFLCSWCGICAISCGISFSKWLVVLIKSFMFLKVCSVAGNAAQLVANPCVKGPVFQRGLLSTHNV